MPNKMISFKILFGLLGGDFILLVYDYLICIDAVADLLSDPPKCDHELWLSKNYYDTQAT